MKYLALVVELHHPLPVPGGVVGRDWADAAAETYWPLLLVVASLAARHADAVLNVAVSPSWTALARDTTAQSLAREELDRRAQWSEPFRVLREFALQRWEGDLLGPLHQAHDAGAIELIPTTASPTWLPSVATEPVIARAQVRLAAADFAQRFGTRAQGIWLPFLSYVPGLESVLAESGLRYFGVGTDAFVRGTVRPPEDVFVPLVTPPGVAAFGVSPLPTDHLTDPSLRYARDPRYADRAQARVAAKEHAAHFVEAWHRLIASAWNDGAISVAGLSAHDLGGDWSSGASWLDAVLGRLLDAGGDEPRLITLGRFLDRYPEGVLGRPGPSAGGWLSARPGGTDILDRVRISSEALRDAVERRGTLGPLGHRALAQMARALLQAQRLDWHLPPGHALEVEAALDAARRHLERFHELAASLASGRLDPARLAELEEGPAYLPDIDPDLLAAG
jgi:1,4-alpha-glucan branching enzyme